MQVLDTHWSLPASTRTASSLTLPKTPVYRWVSPPKGKPMKCLHMPRTSHIKAEERTRHLPCRSPLDSDSTHLGREKWVNTNDFHSSLAWGAMAGYSPPNRPGGLHLYPAPTRCETGARSHKTLAGGVLVQVALNTWEMSRQQCGLSLAPHSSLPFPLPGCEGPRSPYTLTHLVASLSASSPLMSFLHKCVRQDFGIPPHPQLSSAPLIWGKGQHSGKCP